MNNLDSDIKKLRVRDPKVTFTLNTEQSAINILRGNLAAPVNVSELRKSPYEHARQFLRENKSIVGEIDETNELINERAMTNRHGMTHVVFQQKHGDALVMGGTLSAHYGADGGMYLVKSNLTPIIDVPKEPKIPADRAVEIAKKHAGEGALLYENMNPILTVVDAKTLHLDDEPQRYYLCWKIGVILPSGLQQVNSFYFVDALNGEIRLVYPAVQMGIGMGHYSQGIALNSEAFGTTYRLRDIVTSLPWPVTNNKLVIHLFDDNGSTSLNLINYSEDFNDNWDNGRVNPSNRADDQSEEVDLHRYMGYVLSYYYQTHGHNGWDGKGADSRCHAHNECYPNNAFWDNLGNEMYFASGDGKYYDFMCPLDVVGHEFTHGVISGFNILQLYKGETGALNEAIADIFGALVSLQYPAEVPNPWIHGSQYDLPLHLGRNMSDPSRDINGVVQYNDANDTTKLESYPYCPDHYSIRYKPRIPWTKNNDFGGVHVNAPIITHAVYLMINGGIHRLSNISVTGIGVAPVEEMLYEIISSGLLNNTSDFADFCIAFIEACQTLYPENLDYLVTVKAAFDAVGIAYDI
ncbi:M4 family metallopeptidase [Methanosarcina sp. UBA5]|uniref:M4 family metallopeptidase n=1 Tax=Methanosarcina sp. UBA5 TaxID=1915593 RepID=UPI0025EC7934|nr:M4 family metallopeptidase [Methanosarcina sp. UBA5]